MSMKNSIDTIGNPNRDLPACSAVPQPTALPRAATSTVPCRNAIINTNSDNNSNSVLFICVLAQQPKAKYKSKKRDTRERIQKCMMASV